MIEGHRVFLNLPRQPFLGALCSANLYLGSTPVTLRGPPRVDTGCSRVAALLESRLDRFCATACVPGGKTATTLSTRLLGGAPGPGAGEGAAASVGKARSAQQLCSEKAVVVLASRHGRNGRTLSRKEYVESL